MAQYKFGVAAAGKDVLANASILLFVSLIVKSGDSLELSSQ